MRVILQLFFLVSLSINCFASDYEKKYGNWYVVKTDSGLAAGTINDAGGILLITCYSSSQKCVHTLSLNMPCNNDGRYPILINSDYSAISDDAICSKHDNDNSYSFILTKFDETQSVLRKGTYIGFAIPLESGLFKVARFNLNGSDKAIDYMLSNLKSDELFL